MVDTEKSGANDGGVLYSEELNNEADWLLVPTGGIDTLDCES